MENILLGNVTPMLGSGVRITLIRDVFSVPLGTDGMYCTTVPLVKGPSRTSFSRTSSRCSLVLREPRMWGFPSLTSTGWWRGLGSSPMSVKWGHFLGVLSSGDTTLRLLGPLMGEGSGEKTGDQNWHHVYFSSISYPLLYSIDIQNRTLTPKSFIHSESKFFPNFVIKL